MNFFGTLASMCLLAIAKCSIKPSTAYNVTVTHEDKF